MTRPHNRGGRPHRSNHPGRGHYQEQSRMPYREPPRRQHPLPPRPRSPPPLPSPEHRRTPPWERQNRGYADNYGYVQDNGYGYAFRGAANQYGSHYPPQSDFTYRNNAYNYPQPQYAQYQRPYDHYGRYDHYEHYEPPPPPPTPPREQIPPPPPSFTARAKHLWRQNGQRGKQADYDKGGKRYRPATHERDLLRQPGGTTPPQLRGMNEDDKPRFNDDAFASSDESSDDSSNDGESDGEGPRKRVKTDIVDPSEQAAPKWSNAEYLAYPPTVTSAGPKKDIVAEIRKAKIEQESAANSKKNAVEANDDFISLDDLGPPSDAPSGPRVPQTLAKRVEFDKHEEAVQKRRSKAISEGSKSMSLSTVTKAREAAASDSSSESMSDSEDSTQPPELPMPGAPALSSNNSRGAPPPPPSGVSESLSLADRIQGGPPTKVEESKDKKGNKKRKAAAISQDIGGILAEWAPSPYVNSKPWCTVDHSYTADPGFRLHKEIADFYEFVRPHDYETAVRQNIIDRVQQGVRTFSKGPSKGVEIRCFGSFASGVYLPTADMDLVALSPRFLTHGVKTFCQSKNLMFGLARHLEQARLATQWTVIGRAKVPIVKFTDRLSGVKVDISFENDTGLVANQTFAKWKQEYPAMPIIVVLIKQMLAMRGLNEVFTGGLGGFSIICLVVSMMQHMPEFQSGHTDGLDDLGKLLSTFLDLYGNKFDYEQTGIKFQPPTYFNKATNPVKGQNNHAVTIIDPNNPANDISGGSRLTATIFKCFATAYSDLQQRLEEIRTGTNVEGSILDVIVGGNYTKFITERNRMKSLHESQVRAAQRSRGQGGYAGPSGRGGRYQPYS